MSERHKVFLSYYHKDDNIWRERFEEIFSVLAILWLYVVCLATVLITGF